MAVAYPVSVFHFQIEWGGTRIGFSEVSGLTIGLQAIDYREGNSLEYPVKKMPGIPQFSNIVLKRGVFRADNEFFKWLTTVKKNSIEPRDLTISLLNEDHKLVMVWKVKGAWPCKVEGPTLNSTGNELAIEHIELCHEGLVIEIP